MECFLLYWDELDDLVWLLVALKERVRRGLLAIGRIAAVLGVATLGAMTADANPLAALSIAGALWLGLMIRAAAAHLDTKQA